MKRAIIGALLVLALSSLASATPLIQLVDPTTGNAARVTSAGQLRMTTTAQSGTQLALVVAAPVFNIVDPTSGNIAKVDSAGNLLMTVGGTFGLSSFAASSAVCTDSSKNLTTNSCTAAPTTNFNGLPITGDHDEVGIATITLGSTCTALASCGTVTVTFGTNYTSTSTYSCRANYDSVGQNAATLSSLASIIVTRTSSSQATFTAETALTVVVGTTSQVIDWSCDGN